MKRICLPENLAGDFIAYEDHGSGPVVLLVHGITTWSFLWRQVAKLLESQYRVISIDLYGCGESGKSVDISFSVKNHARIIEEFCRLLQLDQIHYVGHDIGGGIGQVLSIRSRERLRSLTLVNSVGHDFWPVQPIVIMRTPIIRQFALATIDIGSLRLVVQRGLFHKEKLSEDIMSQFWRPMRTKEGRRAFLHFAKCLNNKHLIEIEADLKELDLPVCIIRGDRDLYLSGAIAEKLNNDIPGSILKRIDTGGHFVQLDEPDLLADHIMEFLAQYR